jgi:hypothetical protein
MLVAKGIPPLSAEERLTTLFVLLSDPDPEIKAAAAATFGSLPENITIAGLGGTIDGRVLGFILSRMPAGDKRAEVIIQNKYAPDDAIAAFASVCDARVADIVATNQQRILRYVQILEGLHRNKNTPKATLANLLEFAEREGLFSTIIPELGGRIVAEGEEPPPPPPPVMVSKQEAAQMASSALPTLPQEVLDALPPEALLEIAQGALPDDLTEVDLGWDGQHERLTVVQKIRRMTVAQKIVLGQRGNKEARTLLSRESNKLILLSLISSPKITDAEVTVLASNKSMNEEVIRVISNNRDWTKDYKMKMTLIYNPKAPLKVTQKWLGSLTKGDLKDVSKSKNISAALAVTARRMLQAHEERTSGKH